MAREDWSYEELLGDLTPEGRRVAVRNGYSQEEVRDLLAEEKRSAKLRGKYNPDGPYFRGRIEGKHGYVHSHRHAKGITLVRAAPSAVAGIWPTSTATVTRRTGRE